MFLFLLLGNLGISVGEYYFCAAETCIKVAEAQSFMNIVKL